MASRFRNWPRISHLFFQALIIGGRGEEVRFRVPASLRDLRKLA